MKTSKTAKAVLFSAIIVFASACSTTNTTNSCQQIRAGFDIGSGETKMTVAEVDVCQKKTLKILIEDRAKVSYQEDLNRSNDNSLSDSISNAGLKVLLDMKSKAEALKPSHYQGVATSAFRKAANGASVAKTLSQKSGIEIRVISQEEEGLIGRAAALSLLKQVPPTATVWDVGGGSQQITVNKSAENQNLLVHNVEIASVGYKDRIIKEIQRRDINKFKSPNPMTKKQMSEALKMSRELAKQVPPEIAQAIRNSNIVVGIGGVHWFSIRGYTKTDEHYTAADIKRALNEYTGKTDSQISDQYPETVMTNFLLIQGYMEVLGVEKVYPLKVNLSIGALL